MNQFGYGSTPKRLGDLRRQFPLSETNLLHPLGPIHRFQECGELLWNIRNNPHKTFLSEKDPDKLRLLPEPSNHTKRRNLWHSTPGGLLLWNIAQRVNWESRRRIRNRRRRHRQLRLRIFRYFYWDFCIDCCKWNNTFSHRFFFFIVLAIRRFNSATKESQSPKCRLPVLIPTLSN